MKILGTGLTGLVGSRVVELLKNKCEFENLSFSTGFDITNRDQIIEKIKTSNSPIILHFAAKTNVDECEKDRDKDIKILKYKDIKKQEEEFVNLKTAWGINVLGTKNVVDACSETGKKIVFISTDFIFDGNKTHEDAYFEEDKGEPVNWYGKTKFEAEKIVQKSKADWIIARIAYPYRASFEKSDFVRKIIEKLKKREKVQALTDHIFTPTFIDDIAFVLDFFIENKSSGIFHVVGDESLTPYEASLFIADIFSFDEKLISKTTREKYFENRAKRPFNLAMKNDKIEKLGLNAKGFEEGIREVKKQLNLLRSV